MASKTETETKKPEKEDDEKKKLDIATAIREDPNKKDKKLRHPLLLEDFESEQYDNYRLVRRSRQDRTRLSPSQRDARCMMEADRSRFEYAYESLCAQPSGQLLHARPFEEIVVTNPRNDEDNGGISKPNKK